HAGVFGPDDNRRRAAHLRFVASLVRDDAIWLTRPSDVAAWWEAREQLEVRVRPDHVAVTNRAAQRLVGVRLLIERGSDEELLELPPLAAGETVCVAVGAPAALSGTGTACPRRASVSSVEASRGSPRRASCSTRGIVPWCSRLPHSSAASGPISSTRG